MTNPWPRARAETHAIAHDVVENAVVYSVCPPVPPQQVRIQVDDDAVTLRVPSDMTDGNRERLRDRVTCALEEAANSGTWPSIITTIRIEPDDAHAIVYAGGRHDRPRRDAHDPDWVRRQYARDGARGILINMRRRFAVRVTTDDPVMPHVVPLGDLQPPPLDSEMALLGWDDVGPLVAVSVIQKPPLPEGVHWRDLRDVAARMSPADAGLLAHAQALLFNRLPSLCSRCGRPLRPQAGGASRVCIHGHVSWPQIDPVAIVLVEDRNRVLLGRRHGCDQPRFEPIERFVEAGESAERAAVQAAWREARAPIDDLRWYGSQPWPYENQLMLAVRGRFNGRDVRAGDGELAEVRWFTDEDVAAALDGRPHTPFLAPAPDTIARALLQSWLTQIQKKG